MTSPTDGPDQTSHGHEYPPLENSGPPTDSYPPVDYPTDGGQPSTGYPGQYGYPPPAYPQGGYPQAGYPPPPPVGPYQGYQAGYPNSYDPYGAARPVGTNGKAIAALVLSVAGLGFCGLTSIVGLILGVLAMRETKRTGQDGHGLALAGVIIGAIITVLFVVGFIVYVIFIAVAVSSPNYY